jgi:hypothetical protein
MQGIALQQTVARTQRDVDVRTCDVVHGYGHAALLCIGTKWEQRQQEQQRDHQSSPRGWQARQRRLSYA